MAEAIGHAAVDYAGTVQGLAALGITFNPMDGPDLLLVNNGGSINVYAEYPQPFSSSARAEQDGG
jgi:hypothetical protein